MKVSLPNTTDPHPTLPPTTWTRTALWLAALAAGLTLCTAILFSASLASTAYPVTPGRWIGAFVLGMAAWGFGLQRWLQRKRPSMRCEPRLKGLLNLAGLITLIGGCLYLAHPILAHAVHRLDALATLAASPALGRQDALALLLALLTLSHAPMMGVLLTDLIVPFRRYL